MIHHRITSFKHFKAFKKSNENRIIITSLRQKKIQFNQLALFLHFWNSYNSKVSIIIVIGISVLFELSAKSGEILPRKY